MMLPFTRLFLVIIITTTTIIIIIIIIVIIIESTQAQAFWDVQVYAEHTVACANRVDARIVDHKEKSTTGRNVLSLG